jgi:SNF2 family DNA or RNA helicase
VEDEEACGPHPLPALVRHSAKLEALDKMLPKLRSGGHRVLLFCTMTRVLDVLEEYLDWRGWKWARLDGTSGSEERGEAVASFQAPGSDVFVFLLSVRAGGFGLNLQSADTVIMYDSGTTHPHPSLAVQSLSPPPAQIGTRRLTRKPPRVRTASARPSPCS